MRSSINKYPITSFVVINYLISWTFLYPCYQLIMNAEDGEFPLLALIGFIGAYGPSIAALIIVGTQNGVKGIKDLFRKFLIWKVKPLWYISILILPLFIYGLSIALVAGNTVIGDPDYWAFWKSIAPFYLLALPFGPLGEELGWRGYLLPELLKKYDIWQSSFILGIIWTVWHTASFTFPGAAIPSVLEVSLWTLFLYLLNILSETLLMTYFFLKTKGSVLIAVILHASFNACSNIILTAVPQIENNVEVREQVYIVNIAITLLVSVILLAKEAANRKVNVDNIN